MKKNTLISMGLIGTVLVGALAAIAQVKRKLRQEIEKKQKMSDKHLGLYRLMVQWVALKQEGKNVAEFLEENGYKKIAVYGMSYVGERLLDELKGSSISIEYIIDQNSQIKTDGIPLRKKDEYLPEVDAVIVTPIFSFVEIEEELSKKLSCPIIAIDDILYEM